MRISSKLITGYLMGGCTEKQRLKILKRIQTDPVFAGFIHLLETSTRFREVPLNPIDVDKMWQKFQLRAKTTATSDIQPVDIQTFHSAPAANTRNISKHLLRVAAVLVLSVSLSYILTHGFQRMPWTVDPHEAFRTVHVTNGERLNINLVDGSSVTIDAGSDFRFFTDYKNERHVYLDGEAFFNVAPDTKCPFYVHTGDALVTVVGTRFNVKAWDAGKTTDITVEAGKVKVEASSPGNERYTMLTKGEQCNVSSDGIPGPAITVDPQDFMKWMNNEVHFTKTRVADILALLTRWYNFRFELEDDSMLDETVTVHIHRANIDEVINVISLVTHTKVVRNGRVVTFLSTTK